MIIYQTEFVFCCPLCTEIFFFLFVFFFAMAKLDKMSARINNVIIMYMDNLRPNPWIIIIIMIT